ncbi:MAG: BrnT family toxin [Rickettsiales bacterium]|nr:BrnT family toxin [Rickettsiales bacterium]
MTKKLSYDVEKRETTLNKHGLDFEDAHEVLFGSLQYTFEDDRFDYGEKRWITVGYLKKRMVVVVWVERGDLIRVISMRKVNEKDQKKYKKRMD